MEDKRFLPMTPFDSLVTTEQLQLMKLMLPYTPASSQRMLATFIKYTEFQNTIHYFRNFKSDKVVSAFEQKSISPIEMLDEMRPFMNEKHQESMDSIMMAMSMMEMMGSMNNTSGDTDGDGDAAAGDGGMGGMNPMDMLQGMLAPDQQAMFDMFSQMKGGDEHERMDEQPPDQENGPGETGTDPPGNPADPGENREINGTDSDVADHERE